ncbi:MAG: glycosyltransferase [Prevotellaceae bacterium]|jgi:glycosyltransferase involved in cell wall biosynthesis|nr:glycosyltransferase [Prevotellaceae bacterium]
MLYSVIIPVYNRPEEVGELLESLSQQEGNIPFEVIIVEDGSTLPCEQVVNAYKEVLTLSYYAKPNTGRSDSRNVGMQRAKGNYFIFFDSDCIIPPCYFIRLTAHLEAGYSDCFGGPDAAHRSFSGLQKAISYAMTSFFTTGGIRGGKQAMETFKPRTFNMGFSRAVYEKTGGFNNMLGEDIDLSIRIAQAGFRISLCREAFVYHKRRISFAKFYRQVRNFGTARINLALLHKGSLKPVHTLPALFLLGGAGIAVAAFFSLWVLAVPALYTALLFADALVKTKRIKTALLSVCAAYIQLAGYGWGFLKACVLKIIFRKGLESNEKLSQIYK